MNLTLISAAVAAAMGFGAAWQIQAGRMDSLKLEQKDARIERDRAARAQAERRVATQFTAATRAQSNLRAAAADRSRLDLVGSGLRDTTAAMRAGDSDAATCHRQVAALGVVLDECTARYTEVAGHAQDWLIEALKQHEAAQ